MEAKITVSIPTRVCASILLTTMASLAQADDSEIAGGSTTSTAETDRSGTRTVNSMTASSNTDNTMGVAC